MINRKQIEKSYNNYKEWAKEYLEQGKMELALESLRIACQLAYHYYLRMSDKFIEDTLFDIGRTVMQSNLQSSDLTNRFVLYDSVAFDNRALTQQYLRALISWDVEFLYIVNDQNKATHAKNILNEVCSCKKGDLFIVPSNLSKVDKIKVIHKKIEEYKPHKAFLHFYISDVVGVVVWNNFNMITRYFINHANHAFWIGTNCSDYVICFRNMGLNVQ
jgi:hypothetical protein